MKNPISHITLGTNDVARAVLFYDAVLGVLEFERSGEYSVDDGDDAKPPAYRKDGAPVIYIYHPEDRRPATWGNGTHIAFVADSRAQVHDFYQAALAHGGGDAGPPGPRPQYADNYYAAYVRDPDGNKLQAVCYE